MACINPNTPEFKAAIERAGGNPMLAEIELSKSLEVEPAYKPIGEESNLQYQFKVVSNLYNNLDKINKLWKQIGNNNTFWNKIQQDFQIPKDQINLLKESEGNTIEEKLTSFAANYSYTVEINTAKIKETNDYIKSLGSKVSSLTQERGRYYYTDERDAKIEIDKDSWEEAKKEFDLIGKTERSTQHYSNLTVAGGTNYTENEIATPAITPNIRGHAQFSTDKGIGWFRSDDTINGKFDDSGAFFPNEEIGLPNTKTRRVLEVQSDLFQKGRDRKDLISYKPEGSKEYVAEHFGGWAVYNSEIGVVESGFTTKEAAEKWLTPKDNKNDFLQLLNKDNNWVTFFVKSIIQDSAKKGYEKVLFPRLDTIIQIESAGRFKTYSEAEKEYKNDRWKENNDRILEELAILKDWKKENFKNYVVDNLEIKDGRFLHYENLISKESFNELLNSKLISKKEELSSNQPDLLITANFYEENLTNVLNKQYGKENIKQVTDEYGNTWNEIEIKEENKQEIYLQKESQSEQKPSENIDNKIKSFLASIGVNIKVVQDLTDSKGNKLSGIAVADMLNKIIQVVDGKADITTLPEEAAHFFVEMLGENNPLFKQMFDKITSYKIYSETVDQYRNNKAYKNADGTLNINKLKKEAIGKLIMTHIIKNETNNENKDKINSAKSWWAKLLEWIKNVFKQTSTNPFAEAAQKIINNDISDLNLDVESNETYFQLEAQSGIEKVIKDQDVIKLDESINPKTGEKKHIYTENGKDIIDKNGNPRSVTNNVVDPWYKNRFPTDSRTTIRKTIDEFSAEKGTDIHADLESILRRFVDKNGDIKATPSPISKIKTNDVIYAKLEQYVMSLLNEFKGKPGTKFLAEVRLYNRKRNLPGTIDLLIMEPDGTTHIYDWKSQQINKDQTELKWFKPLAYRIQLGEYKKILMEEYGIYKFGKIRAIPIATKYTIANVNGKLTPTGLKDIEMEYDIKNIPTDKNYLLPVVMLDESTNDPKLDSLIAKLNAVYEKISIGDVQESEKAFKHDELNILKKAINDLHIRKDMTVFIENGLYEINKYNRKIKDNTFGLKDIKDSLLILNVYAEGSVYLEKLFVDIKNQLKTETNPDIKEYLQNLQEDFLKMSQNAKALLIDIKGIPGEKNPSGVMARLGNEFAQEEGITTLLNPEVQMDFWKRNFRSLTTLSTAAMNTFAKILRRVQAQRNIKIKDLNSKLQTLRKEHEEWARKKGLTGENIFNPILEIDSKGNWNGDFVRIYSAEYFKLRDEALKNEDVNWIKLNTDFDNDGYKKDLENFKNNVEERYPEKNEKTESRKQNLIERWVEKHSPDSKVAYLNKKNFYIKPKAKWQSEKYKTIYAKDSSGKYINEPLKNTYEFFQELIKYSSKIGMLDRYSSRFIPGVYQSAITNIIGSSFKNIYDIQSKFESLVVDSEGGFGNIDPLTGVLKKQMKVYFKKDLGVQNEDGTFDYSNKSKDLFSVFSIWGQQMYNYESMDSIRDKSDILLEIEKIKPRLETNMWSVVKDDKTTIAENSVNAGILEDYINYYIYGEIKGSDVDKAVTINGKDYSLKQATQKVIKAATFKTLALNLLSGTATFVGGTGNAFFQASKKLIFTEKDWIQGTADFTSNNEVTSLGIDFFDLGLDDREKNDVRNLSTSWKKRNMKWDHLLFMQHYGDKWATYPVAAAMLRTFMFDGKNIVSIRDFVKKQNDYDNFYKLPEGERKRVQKKIDKEIQDLQNTKSLKAVGKVENGKFSIPGLEQNSDAAINFKAVVQKTLKGVIGNATRDDMTTLRMGLIGQVLMQFRSWMPQMMAERFGDMTYDVDLETWQYGKARLFLQHLIDGRILPLVKEMVFGFGNNTIEKAKEKYKEFVVQLLAEGKITSEKDFMTEAEFVDMYMGNIRSMMREVLLLASFMFLLFLGAGDDDDDDDDEDVSGFKKYAIKALQKYQNEFSFYYSPTEFTKMLKNPVPLIGVLEDFERFLTQGIGQVYNFGIGDEEGMEKNKPAKYLFKLLPITKEGLNFYALYDDEFRKEWAIR